MDGFKRKISNSLQAQLSFWLFVSIALAAIGGGFFSFRGVLNEANEFQDDQLRQIAGLMQQQQPHTGLLITQMIEPSADPESQVIVQVISADDDSIALLDERVALPASLSEDIHTIRGHRYRWRIFVRRLPSGERLIVGQRTDVRDEIANSSAWRTVYPFILLIPVLLLAIVAVVRYMLRPVKRLSDELDARDETDLSPLQDQQVPAEIRPFTTSINALLQRVQHSMDTQKRFVADAAHELRSPLTALSLQADNIRKTALPAPAQERMHDMQRGLQRMRSLLEQLLVMARSQDRIVQAVTSTPMEQVFKQVLEDLMPTAEARQIEIEVDSSADAVFTGQLFDALMVIKNLIDNAIRYTPAGGQVILRARQQSGALLIVVEDTGPGIADDEMERIFDPFYRILGSGESGSGLGLAIVKAIAERNHAQISLRNRYAEDGRLLGLNASVRFVA